MPSLCFISHIPQTEIRFFKNIAFKFTTTTNSRRPSAIIFIKFREGYRAPLSDKQ